MGSKAVTHEKKLLGKVITTGLSLYFGFELYKFGMAIISGMIAFVGHYEAQQEQFSDLGFDIL